MHGPLNVKFNQHCEHSHEILQILMVQKTPCSTSAPKHPHSAWCYKKNDNEPDSQTKPTWTVPNSLFPNTSVHTRGTQRERDMVTTLKTKYCPLKTSVRQDAATGLFEPQSYSYCIQSLLSSRISSSVVCTNKSVSQDNALFQ